MITTCFPFRAWLAIDLSRVPSLVEGLSGGLPGLNFSAAITLLEEQWDLPDGFFYRLRQGEYDASGVDSVIEILRSVRSDDEALLPRRFVSLTWWIPTFMEWQTERVAEMGGDVGALERDIVRLRNVLDEVLGVP